MKVLLLNTSEQTGGAAIACKRLLYALRKNGVDAKMLVRDRQTDDRNIYSVNSDIITKCLNRWRFVWERLIIWLNNSFSRNSLFTVSIANSGVDISRHPLVKEADVIHLHWINQGFLSLSGIRKLIETGKPVVWTMHDMWPCTAICHHAWTCERFEDKCGRCPFIRSESEHDLSNRVYWKKKFLSASDVQLIAVSSWLQKKAQKSSLTGELNISVIPNLLDISVFFPYDKRTVRERYSLPLTKKIILMGAAKLNDPIKGFNFLLEALSLLESKDDFFLILFGEVKKDSSFLSAIPIEFTFLNVIKDANTIAQLYSAADVTVTPSLYETFGQTVVEAMACGCPVVSFNNSGQSDIINHKTNGYLAEYKDAKDLAKGIEWVLENRDKLNLSDACIEKVRTNYSEDVVATEYVRLYNAIL